MVQGQDDGFSRFVSGHSWGTLKCTAGLISKQSLARKVGDEAKGWRKVRGDGRRGANATSYITVLQALLAPDSCEYKCNKSNKRSTIRRRTRPVELKREGGGGGGVRRPHLEILCLHEMAADPWQVSSKAEEGLHAGAVGKSRRHVVAGAPTAITACQLQ